MEKRECDTLKMYCISKTRNRTQKKKKKKEKKNKLTTGKPWTRKAKMELDDENWKEI